MENKVNLIHELYDETSRRVSSSKDEWKGFLETAGFNFKLRFDEQLLLYAQKPDATAVLEIEKWNYRFHRWVNKGAKGIAVFDDRAGGQQRLKHYFDISDTYKRQGGAEVPLWNMDAKYEEEVIEALEAVYGELVEKDSLLQAILCAAENGAEDHFDAYFEVLSEVKINSFLEDLDEDNLSAAFREIIAESVAYMIGKRLHVEAAHFDEDSFRWLSQFNTKDTLNALGYAVSDIAEMGLSEVAKTIRSIERENRTFAKTEPQRYNQEKESKARRKKDETDLHREKGIPVSGHRNAERTESTPGRLGSKEKELSDAAQESDVLQSADFLRAEQPSGGNRTSSAADDGSDNRTDDGAGGTDREPERDRADEVDITDEQYQTGSQGNGTERFDLQLEYFDRRTEDKSLPFFNTDKVTKAIHQFSMEELFELEKLYQELDDPKERIEKLKLFFSNKVQKESPYGWKLYENVLFLYEGSLESPISGAYYNWSVIESHIEGMITVGELYHEISHTDFTFSQELIDFALTRGSNIEHSKFRIYEQFQKSLSQKENVEFLKKEYGWGGTSSIKAGTGIGEDYNSKGIELHRGYMPEAPRIFLKWADAAKRIELLVKTERYLNRRELEEYPKWLAREEERKQQLQAEREKRQAVEIRYDYHLGDTVYLGASEYEILAVDDETVRLYDKDCPLINQELSREIFERRVRENPANNHLIKREIEPMDVKSAESQGDEAEKQTESNAPEELTEKNESIPEENEEILPAPPAKKRQEKAGAFDLHPEIPLADRMNFDLAAHEVEAAGKKERFRRNMEAIRVLKSCESENRFAAPQEQEVLSKYVGWGGIPEAFEEHNSAWASEFAELYETLSPEEYAEARESTLTAFYTSPEVIQAVYKVLENMGFQEGNILEPSCGTGNFIGLLPPSMQGSKVYGVEIDSISARISQQLYQKASIAAQGFEEVSLPDSFFDVAVGNVPFGDFKVFDKKYDRHNFLIHDYFFAKTLDKVRPGGIIAFITSKGTLDKANPKIRKYIAQRAELLGAIRLPNDTFTKNAGTEVTSDILFLQKRDRFIDIEPEWVYLDKDENGIEMNRYFVEHPEMILGEMKMVSGRFGEESACVPFEHADLKNLLETAVTNIHGTFEAQEIEEVEAEIYSIPADPDVRNFSFTVVDGEIYFRENARMYRSEVSETAKNRIKGLISLRESVRHLIDLQREDYPDSEIKREQENLNRLYDAFTKKYGMINSRANSTAFSEDSSYYLLSALEILDSDGNLIRKADMFSKRTIKPHTPITRVDTASDALALSIGEKACVDMAYMEELTGKEERELCEALKGVIFLNPMYRAEGSEAKYLMADEYLSGNVREKLAIARKAAEASLKEYAVNVEALEKVQPKDLTASEISVRLGATWLPVDVVSDFMFELLSTPRYMQWKMKVHYSEYTGEWRIEGKNTDKSNVKVHKSYGTSRINAYKIIEETLNLKDVRIYDYEVDADGKRTAVLNTKETAIAQSKQEQIKKAFTDWIWKEPERRERLTRLYNEKFNSVRAREYDGSHIIFSGMNPEITLRKHQVNAIAHILYGGNTLLAHAVGAGKTFEMVAAAMESKRLGLCTKSMFVVPNHLTEQWAAEFLQLYPSANILVATKKDFQRKNRKRFCGKIATGEYDAVIIGHTQFEKIPMSVERQKAILEKQLDEIMLGINELKRNNGERFSIKALEKSKKQLKLKLEKLNDQSRKDDVVTFEELGVDRLFVDESHYYKNLFLYTKMRNVGGIAQTEAQKSSDLFMKCRYLDEMTGGKGIVFATGTPISNSMVELYTIQRYLQYNTLVQNNLQHFDAWASTFGETITAVELTPEGTGYRAKTRFARFYNLPELMAMFKEIADIKTADMLDLPVPTAVFHNISVKPSEIQKQMVAELAERAERVRNGMVDAKEDNMLKITNDGRKLALDQRLINPLLPDFEDSKLNACVDAMFETWERGSEKRLTQLFFCDLSTPKNDGSFNVYDDIRQKLIARGVPADEIKFIHEADTEAKKLELFKKVRRGDVRILMGSTQKMGAGTNVQNKLAASSDLDCPWRPSDLEQRLGRSIRQGNENAEVHIYRFVTEETFDAYLYQLVEGKQKFASQIMTSKSPVRSCEDIDETALSYAEIKMLATGNPHIKEKMDLDIQVQKLRLLKSSFLSEKYALEDKIIKFYPQEIARRSDVIAGLKSDIERVTEHPKPSDETFVGMTVKGAFYSEKADAGNAILEACKEMTNPEPIPLGEYRGFTMELYFEAREYKVRLKGELGYPVTLGTDTFGNITRLDNALEGLPKRLEMNEMELDNLKKQFETAKVDVERPFPQEEELKAKTDRLNELNALLNVDKRENEIVGGEPDEGEELPEKKQRDLER